MMFLVLFIIIIKGFFQFTCQWTIVYVYFNIYSICYAGADYQGAVSYIDCGESFLDRWATCLCTTKSLEDFTIAVTNRARCRDWPSAPIQIRPEPDEEEEEQLRRKKNNEEERRRGSVRRRKRTKKRRRTKKPKKTKNNKNNDNDVKQKKQEEKDKKSKKIKKLKKTTRMKRMITT